MLLAIPAWFLVPWVGRRLDFFRVTEVEVRGARFARPADIVAALAIDTRHSLWNETAPLAARVTKLPHVKQARISRRPPNALVVHVVERVPVAFVQEKDGLKAFDAAGRVLPLDPTRATPDVPVIVRRDSVVFALLGDLLEFEPDFFARISEVRPVERDQLRFVMVDMSVLAMRDVSADRFAELSSVASDLARRQTTPRELDLRFKDQVIARLP
jgi:cell division protein FtsQ